MKNAKRRAAIALMMLGILLVSAALIITVLGIVADKNGAEASEMIVSKMEELMPPVKDGALDDRENVMMPMLEIDGESFVGIIEFPLRDVKLPVGAVWGSDKYLKYPCRYTGSIYDGTLVIGCSGSQLGLLKSISFTDKVYVTDAMGSRFSYSVEDVYFVKEISAEILNAAEGDVVLFSKGTYESEYTVVLLKR